VITITIHLVGAELNAARVAQRVSEEGHDMPADKLIQRIPRMFT
jgi:predicted ABC-type ATPase